MYKYTQQTQTIIELKQHSLTQSPSFINLFHLSFRQLCNYNTGYLWDRLYTFVGPDIHALNINICLVLHLCLILAAMYQA